MPLTERQVVGQVSIGEHGDMRIRTDTVIEKDGVEIARTFHSKVIEPGADFMAEDQKVVDVANVVHTPAVVNKWNSRKAEANAKIPKPGAPE